MIYEMGQSRSKDAPFWRDPFAAYRISDDNQPIPLRPIEGKAIWREFAGLFLHSEAFRHDDATGKGVTFLRPHLLNQLDELQNRLDELGDVDDTAFPFLAGRYPFRTIGLRTDMKMKIFEWEEAGFDIPITVLFGLRASQIIRDAVEFATKCDGILKSMYQRHFSGPLAELPAATPVKGSPVIRAQMVQRYWQQLGDAFRLWLVRFEPAADGEALSQEWLQTVLRTGTAVFRQTAESLNTGTSTALVCEQAINHCRASLYSYRHKIYPQEDKE
jgi:hypothetical protein